jgi:serine/threonine protein kinase
MTPEQRKAAKAISEAAQRMDASTRNNFVEAASAGDASVSAEVSRLLQDSLLHNPSLAQTETIVFQGSVFSAGELVSGRYQILRYVAKGGMGEVYEARDLELGETLALKTLLARISHDEEDIARLKREVQIARKINHPNVCRIHDLGYHLHPQGGKVFYLTMEFLSGETLSMHISRLGRLSTEQALPLVSQMVGALAAAHQLHIIHRDFKSSNVMLVPDGNRTCVKVTDFGLARSVEGSNDGALTLSRHILGTPPYMPPEQFLGEASKVGDIYALGVVMYEMLTGALPFDPHTPPGNRDTPPLKTHLPDLDLRWETTILKCLRADSAGRFAQVEEVASTLRGAALKDASVVARRRTVTRSVIAALLLIALTSGLLFMRGRHFPVWRPVSQRAPGLGSNPVQYLNITDQPGRAMFPSLSPDGRSLLYALEVGGNSAIYLQRVGGTHAVNLTPDSRFDSSEAVWSPDGERIAYRSEREGGGIDIMGSAGEPIKRLINFGHQPSWSPDGSELVVATELLQDLSGVSRDESILWIVETATGRKRQLAGAQGYQPSWSPHGSRIAFWSFHDGQPWLRTISSRGGAPVELVHDDHVNWNPVWSADGKFIYFLSNRSGSMNLWRIAVDEAAGTPVSSPEPITLPTVYAEHISVSRDGKTLAYVNRTEAGEIYRASFDAARERLGAVEALTQGTRFDSMPDVSSDGRSVVFVSGGERPDQLAIAPVDRAGAPRQITDNRDKATKYSEPRWSPDGQWIAFQSNQKASSGARDDQIWAVRPDGSDLRELTHVKGDAVTPVWSPSSRRIGFSMVGGYTWSFAVDDSLTPQPSEPFAAPEDRTASYIVKSWSSDGMKLVGAQFRPDGKSIGIFEYFLNTRKFGQLTTFGSAPLWLSDNKRVVFRSNEGLFVVDSVTREQRPLQLPVGTGVRDTFSVSRDDRWVYFCRASEGSDVWIIKTE